MAEEVIEGYRVVNTIAMGQNSQVLEVVEVASHRHFAMKILLPQKEKDAVAKRMLQHEAQVGLELTHPNVIKIHAVGKSQPFFVMEFFPAGSLKFRIMRKQTDYIKENAASILKQSATAFAYMNSSGWVHRDIKPENMLINSAGDLKIIDFALALKIESSSFFSRMFRFKRRFVQGTRSYMSPEQIRGEPLDPRSDIYNYGVACFEMVTGRPTFEPRRSGNCSPSTCSRCPPGRNISTRR